MFFDQPHHLRTRPTSVIHNVEQCYGAYIQGYQRDRSLIRYRIRIRQSIGYMTSLLHHSYNHTQAIRVSINPENIQVLL